MKMIIGIVFGGAMCTALYLGSSQRFAHASTDIDCSKLTKWKSNHDYRKGDLVWFKPSSQNRGREYKCLDAACRGSQPDRSSIWKVVAECKAFSDPK
jgi:hypothetical protein